MAGTAVRRERILHNRLHAASLAAGTYEYPVVTLHVPSGYLVRDGVGGACAANDTCTATTITSLYGEELLQQSICISCGVVCRLADSADGHKYCIRCAERAPCHAVDCDRVCFGQLRYCIEHAGNSVALVLAARDMIQRSMISRCGTGQHRPQRRCALCCGDARTFYVYCTNCLLEIMGLKYA